MTDLERRVERIEEELDIDVTEAEWLDYVDEHTPHFLEVKDFHAGKEKAELVVGKEYHGDLSQLNQMREAFDTDRIFVSPDGPLEIHVWNDSE